MINYLAMHLSAIGLCFDAVGCILVGFGFFESNKTLAKRIGTTYWSAGSVENALKRKDVKEALALRNLGLIGLGYLFIGFFYQLLGNI